MSSPSVCREVKVQVPSKRSLQVTDDGWMGICIRGEFRRRRHECLLLVLGAHGCYLPMQQRVHGEVGSVYTSREGAGGGGIPASAASIAAAAAAAACALLGISVTVLGMSQYGLSCCAAAMSPPLDVGEYEAIVRDELNMGT
eukprot:CAMPEP_0119207008 /NCGR_PEP_ID=MMETSP1316-20130426/40678_1 /TAXON_ID=41880 /ORGANISM="Pycnococcus provasolii, Strain RCC2336" /LENGTH=141 /DNA_ID=CAMNT_0007203411 /DNA_START=106 /DNA_END=532 /DNA_ORIENTATION=+